jgi:hypothetical protein
LKKRKCGNILQSRDVEKKSIKNIISQQNSIKGEHIKILSRNKLVFFKAFWGILILLFAWNGRMGNRTMEFLKMKFLEKFNFEF